MSVGVLRDPLTVILSASLSADTGNSELPIDEEMQRLSVSAAVTSED